MQAEFVISSGTLRGGGGECTISNVSNSYTISIEKRKLNEFKTFVRNNKAIHIIRKVTDDKTMDSIVSSRNIFGIPSNYIGNSTKNNNDLVLLSSKGVGYINSNELDCKKLELSKKYNVIITYAMSGGNKPSSSGTYQVISSLKITEPGTIFSETYLCIGSFDNYTEAYSLSSYISTKFARFLLLQALSSIHITKDCFTYVPVQKWDHQYTDCELYSKYGLSNDEISTIENTIKELS